VTRRDVEVFELNKQSGYDLGLISRLAGVFRRHRLDVVHSNNWGTLVETVLARHRAATSIHVHAERGTVLGDFEAKSWLRRWGRARLMRYALNSANGVIAVADSVRDRVAKLTKFPANRVQVIRNGVDIPDCDSPEIERHRIRTILGLSGGVLLVGSVGRLIAVKDFTTAISAIKQLNERGMDVHLVIVGDGPERSHLQSLVESSQVVRGRVHLVGEQTDVGSWLAALDVYVNTSTSEGMSQSILEAMAAGLPMVVTDVGQSAPLVNGQSPCGLVVAPSNSGMLADAIANLLTDGTRRNSFAKNALLRHVSRYSVGGMVREYETLYLKLVRSHKVNRAARRAIPVERLI
jgi:glycosyltransferase involved in cell wall biosynthesis